MASIILIRGGGDLATGVALRLIRSGLRVVITELPQPLTVRRKAAFSEAIYDQQTTVEGVTACYVPDWEDTLHILGILSKNQVPILVDPECRSAGKLHPAVIVDARMTKKPPEQIGYSPILYIGLGPGFIGGQNCQAVIETRRGHNMGRVFWQEAPQADTGQPEGNPQRVLRAPVEGELVARAEIGQIVEEGAPIAEINGQVICAPFRGVLRGLLHPGLIVAAGTKIGDLDPCADASLCSLASDKSLAVGGGVLEAILNRGELRKVLWDA